MQLTRRETVLGSLASLAQNQLPTTTYDTWHFDIASGPARIAARLQGRGRATLRLITGIRSKHLLPFDYTRDDRILVIDASERQMEVTMAGRTFVVWPESDCAHLVTAWTLPFLGIGGLLGFHGADIEEVSRSNARFFDVPLDDPHLPSALAWSRTTAVYAVFFGEIPSMKAMNDALVRLTDVVEPHVDVVAAAALVESHEPRLLLTIFNDNLGSKVDTAGEARKANRARAKLV